MAILSHVFDPESIALIGASDREGSVGRIILTNLLNAKDSKIFPVNPRKKTLLAHECFPDIRSIPEHVDLAVIATPAKGVPALVEECGKAGVDGAVIISAGFKETGSRGQFLEQQISEISKRYGMRILGPNCLGFIRPNAGLNTTFMKTTPPSGNIAFISQSATLGSAILDWAVDRQVGFSMFASLGSMLDIGFGDMIDFLSHDWKTESILIYMEEIGNARKFMSAARAFALRKPIIILKPGRFTEKAKAEWSCPGPAEGNDAVYDAAFKRVGAMRVKDIQGLFRAASVLHSRKLPRGPRLAIVTTAGLEYAAAGPGMMARDALIELGGEPARFSPSTLDLLENTLPPHWHEGNPVDVLGDADTARYIKAIDACLEDPGVDGALVIYIPMNIAGPEEVARAVIGSAGKTGKPIVAAWMGGTQVRKAREVLIQNNIPTYETPEEAVITYLGMVRYRKNLDLLHETPSELPERKDRSKQHLRGLINQALQEGRTSLNERESKELLESYGIPSADSLMARSLAETRGVTENGDYELILGAKRDRDFGSVIYFGMGGKTVDLIRDFSIGLPPLNQTLAKRLMEETKAYKLIQGSRGKTPANLEALEETLVNFSNLIVDFPEISEIEINPLAVSKGTPYALAARIALAARSPDGHSQYPHLVITPYPIRLVENWKLKDGTDVVLRPARPEDEPLARDFLSSLSEETLRTRFFSTLISITHDWLVICCDTDYDRRLAIQAIIEENGQRRVIGVGTLFVDSEKNSGEFALLVHDDFQGRGLACKLLQFIIEQGRERGLDEIDGLVLSENTRMLSLARKLGFTRKLQGETTMVSLSLK